MARTQESIDRQAALGTEISELEPQMRLAHIFRAGNFLIALGLVIDDISNGAITKALDSGVLNHLDAHIGTGNLNATRLSLAGLYVASGAVQLVRETRRRNLASNLEAIALQEVQSDRIATALELASGQRHADNVILDPGENLPTRP